MKRIFTISAVFLLAMVSLSSCVKDRVVVQNDESYWLTKEQGEVVYSDASCGYWVLATSRGYAIVYTNGYNKPYEGDIIYGNFSSAGTRDLYNFSGRFVFTGTVTDYWLTLNQSLDAMDYYCPLYGGKTQPRVFKESSLIKKE